MRNLDDTSEQWDPMKQSIVLFFLYLWTDSFFSLRSRRSPTPPTPRGRHVALAAASVASVAVAVAVDVAVAVAAADAQRPPLPSRLAAHSGRTRLPFLRCDFHLFIFVIFCVKNYEENEENYRHIFPFDERMDPNELTTLPYWKIESQNGNLKKSRAQTGEFGDLALRLKYLY